MQRDETKVIIAAIVASYPNYKPTDIKDTVDVWTMMLEEYDFNLVQMALKAYISTDRSGFAPSIGQLIDKIHGFSEKNDELTEMEMWVLVRKAINNSGYHALEEFEKLPDIAKKVIGSANQLYQWSQTDISDIETVIQSNFMRSYKARLIDQKERARMPVDINTMIEQKGCVAIGSR